MSTKFFTNRDGNTLFEKFKELAKDMADFYSFQAVAGFFRSSGYFKLREELKQANKGNDVSKIQILVGINIDNIFKKHNKANLMLEASDEAKKIYTEDFIKDVKDSNYTKEVEGGILQLCKDLADGRVEIRLHATKNLHAKFYLCLPENHTPSNAGFVIMGSSNISNSGLGTLQQANRYELNMSTSEYDDVQFCKDEFKMLWNEAVPIKCEDLPISETHLQREPTPYELYMKVLIDSFGSQVEDDFTIELPQGVRDLKYQKDAVIQGYQMLMQHKGFFLADVVGLGKTIVAAMIAKRFVESNGRHTRILVVHPPAMHTNWDETFKLFKLDRKTDFVNNGSLNKIIGTIDRYKAPEEYDLIIVDEAHRFRTGGTIGYDELQRICKSSRTNSGLIKGDKRVMLLSATPLNNRPEDLQNLILLFQDAARCTVEGVPNITNFFAPLVKRYKDLMSSRKKKIDIKEVDKIYEEIRNRLLDKITVRRTRHNIWNDENYRNDLESQNIKFPEILPPNDFTYRMDEELSSLFYETLNILTDMPSEENPKGKGLNYARYIALKYLYCEKEEEKRKKSLFAINLAEIYRVHMVKRLESSFFAFYRSLETLLGTTLNVIKMFQEGKVLVAPELKITNYIRQLSQDENRDFGEIIDAVLAKAAEKGFTADEIVYATEDFDPKYLELLKDDYQKLSRLKKLWGKVCEEKKDPKLDLFLEKMKTEFFEKSKNLTGKLVIFSESVDTVNYLSNAIKERLGRNDLLSVSSKDVKQLEKVIRKCFDANLNDDQSDKYNIIVTSDVLSEGVNLHRSNIIINYDTPWNATSLMQRIGRVNRIGSVADKIYNYMFYPSVEGNEQIELYKNALIKLQGFHSALGEDAQIFSKEEIVKQFKLYDPAVKDKVDKQLKLLREVRALYNTDRDLYRKIKNLPIKSRAARDVRNRIESSKASTIVFVKSPIKTEYYVVENEMVRNIPFLDAVDILRADKSERGIPIREAESIHYPQVQAALNAFEKDFNEKIDSDSLVQILKTDDKATARGQKFLKLFEKFSDDKIVKQYSEDLSQLLKNGTYKHLGKELNRLGQSYKGDEIKMKKDEYRLEQTIRNLHEKYCKNAKTDNSIIYETPMIVVSETFIEK